jgi:hypothetical protein
LAASAQRKLPALTGTERPVGDGVSSRQYLQNPQAVTFPPTPLPHEGIDKPDELEMPQFPAHPHSTGASSTVLHRTPCWRTTIEQWPPRRDPGAQTHRRGLSRRGTFALGSEPGSSAPPLPPASAAPTARGSSGGLAEAEAPPASCVRADGVTPLASIMAMIATAATPRVATSRWTMCWTECRSDHVRHMFCRTRSLISDAPSGRVLPHV